MFLDTFTILTSLTIVKKLFKKPRGSTKNDNKRRVHNYAQKCSHAEQTN